MGRVLPIVVGQCGQKAPFAFPVNQSLECALLPTMGTLDGVAVAHAADRFADRGGDQVSARSRMRQS